mmetsp:Transcript_27484/g.87414  ORF Transcript_27484/g.87414 Transcript_27484/m.87414 type:complete len:261 (+) Transcript_27484:286-1068(+)
MLFPHDESINRLALQHNHRLDHCEEVGMPSHRASLGPSACAPFAFIQCFDETALTPSSTCPRLSQSPELVCFHSETTSSPLEMARIVPVIDQLTRQTGAEKIISLYWHCSPAIFGKVHTTTFLSCEHVATTESTSLGIGDHATSRTQSVCRAGKINSGTHCPSPVHLQILIKLSQPPEARRLSAMALALSGPCVETAGAHETALQPVLWALNLVTSHSLPRRKVPGFGSRNRAGGESYDSSREVTSKRQYAYSFVGRATC